MFYQSGYLTIKDYDPMFREYTLDYPNDEVRQGFVLLTANGYFKKPSHETDHWIKNLSRMFLRCDLDGIRDAYRSFLSSIPYLWRSGFCPGGDLPFFYPQGQRDQVE